MVLYQIDMSLKYTLFLASGIIILASCSLPTGNDRRTAQNLLERAQAERMVRPEFAIKLLKRALIADPTYLTPHYELALIYSNPSNTNVFNPVAALYHLNEYLAGLQDPTLSSEISNLIQRCKLEIARDVMDQIEGSRLERQLQIERARVDTLLKENAKLKSELEKLQRQLLAQNESQFTSPTFVSQQTNPTRQPTPSSYYQPLTNNYANEKYYTVQPGDTLNQIARRYGIPLQKLIQANPGINPHRIVPGQKIRIP